MNLVRSSAGQAPAKSPRAIEFTSSSNSGSKGQFQQIRDLVRYGTFRRKPNFLSGTLWSVGALCVPLLLGPAPASAQDKSSTPNSAPQPAAVSPSELQSLRDEVRELREELKSLKAATATNTAEVKAVSEKVTNIPAQSDLEALRDIEDENILRSVGSSSSTGAYQVGGGYQHLVNISGYGMVGYTGYIGRTSATTSESFKLTSLGLTLSGYLRQDPGKEGDVNYNLGVIASPYKYNAVSATTQTAANSPAATVNGSTVNGTYLSASDVWLNYAVKTTKLQLEPTWTMSLQLGQYLTPYGIENPSTENNRPTINQAQYISRLGFGRDIGVEAYGGLINRNDPSATTVPLISYTAGVFNGSGANTFDTHNGVDALARLQYNPFYRYAANFRNLSFGANILDGNLGGGNLPEKLRAGGDVQWLRKPFLLTAEYVHSEDNFPGDRNSPLHGTGPLPTAQCGKSDSYIGTLFWTVPTLPDFQPWVRYDHFDPRAFSNLTPTQLATANAGGYGNNARDAYSVGFNWFIWQLNPVTRLSYTSMQTERVLKLQTSYTYFNQSNNGPKGSAFIGANNQIDALLTYNF